MEEAGFERQYFGNIVSAGEVVHRDGKHSRAETGADAALTDSGFDNLEEGTQKAVGSGHFFVERVVVGGQ